MTKLKSNRVHIIFIVSLILAFLLGLSFGRQRPRSFSLGSNEDVDSAQQGQRLEFLQDYINEHYLREVSKDQLYLGQLKGTVAALDDPYSEYLSQEEFDSMMEDASGSFYGIGIYISPRDGMITVVSPIKGSPAEEAGIITGDKILSVDGHDLDGNKAEEASSMIRGDKGTVVKLKIMRESDGQVRTFDIEVVRDEVKIYTVDKADLGYGIAYISISQFNENTYDEFSTAISELDESTRGLILDLRSNPGGLLDSSVQVANELLPQGKIVYTKDKTGQVVDEYMSDEDYLDLPLVTLINGGSASASEIVAGALRDHQRTTLVGNKTFGKGVVQSLNRFSYGDGIKLTISEYFTPKGLSIDQVGIKPDIEVDLEDPTTKLGYENLEEDIQLQRAIEEIKNILD